MSEDEANSEDEIRVQALPVITKENFDPSQPPHSAEEYLQRVVWEASQYKDVVTVELPSDKIRKIPALVTVKSKMKSPEEYVPSQKIQRDFLTQFSQLTERVDRCRSTKNIPKPPCTLPDTSDEEAWCNFCFGDNFYQNLKTKRGNSESNLVVKGTAPLLSILLNISNAAVENLIEWHTNWMEIAGFSEAQGRWLYSLLACLERPLTPETCSILRNILIHASTIRASLETKDHPHLIQLNMLITIISLYFHQDDLADS